MTKITIKLTQTYDGASFEHPESVGFDYNFKIIREEIKFTDRVACNFFLDTFYHLHSYFRGKSFKISFPIRMDVLIDDNLFGSYCQIKAGKSLSKKRINNHRFKVKESDYILVAWNNQVKDTTKRKKTIIVSKESYRQSYLLFNTISEMDNKFEKYWNSVITTPMYS